MVVEQAVATEPARARTGVSRRGETNGYVVWSPQVGTSPGLDTLRHDLAGSVAVAARPPMSRSAGASRLARPPTTDPLTRLRQGWSPCTTRASYGSTGSPAPGR